MPPDRQRLIAAYACISWDTALTHLAALAQVGAPLPEDVLDIIRTEARAYAAHWASMAEVEYADAAADARAYLTEHLEELNALLKEDNE